MYNNTNQKLSRKVRDCILYIRKGSNDGFSVRVSDMDIDVKAPTVEELSHIVREKETAKRKDGWITPKDVGKEIGIFDRLVNIDTSRMIPAKFSTHKTCSYDSLILLYG